MPTISTPHNVVALLDVDHTLITVDQVIESYDDPAQLQASVEGMLNNDLINALKQSRITHVYLFTDMSLTKTNIQERTALIECLQNKGFIVEGVLTPSDRAWTASCAKLKASFDNTPSLKKLSAEKLQKIQTDLSTGANVPYQALKEEITELDSNNLGEAFESARLRISNEEDNYEAQGQQAKIFLDLQAIENQLSNTKGEIFRDFLKKNTEFTDCVVFDDKPAALESVREVLNQEKNKNPNKPLIRTQTIHVNTKTKLQPQEKRKTQTDYLHEIVFHSFEQYVALKGNGVSVKDAQKKARKGAQFLQAIQNNTKIKGTKEENISNLVWLLTARSFSNRPFTKPMDAGMYTLSLDTPEATKRLHDYFAGNNATAHPYWRLTTGMILAPVSGTINLLIFFKRMIIPAPGIEYPGFSGMLDGIAKLFNKRGWAFDENRLAYGRLSSHFKKLTKNHFGYDIKNTKKHQLPGKFKTVVFGLVKDKKHPSRAYFKPESAGADVLNHPWEFIKHSMHYTGAKKAHIPEVTAKEKTVQNKDIIACYLKIMKIQKPSEDNKKAVKEFNKKFKKLNLTKMRENIHSLKNPSERKKGLHKFNKIVAQTHEKNVVKYGDENAFTFTKTDIAHLVAHHSSKIAMPFNKDSTPALPPEQKIKTIEKPVTAKSSSNNMKAPPTNKKPKPKI